MSVCESISPYNYKICCQNLYLFFCIYVFSLILIFPKYCQYKCLFDTNIMEFLLKTHTCQLGRKSPKKRRF